MNKLIKGTIYLCFTLLIPWITSYINSLIPSLHWTELPFVLTAMLVFLGCALMTFHNLYHHFEEKNNGS